MNSGLRKAHKYSWLLLVLIIPLIMYFSIKDLIILDPTKKTDINHNFTKSIPEREFENDLIKVAFYPKNIEIILKTTLKNASSTIYNRRQSQKTKINWTINYCRYLYIRVK